MPKSRPELIDKAYKIYKKGNDEKRMKKADAFAENYKTMWTKIKFLGCYDTVAALGLPIKFFSVILNSIPGLKHRFHDFKLSKSIENAYQALAIDDERKTFHPILWDEEILPYQTVKQVWFAGMHTDVGGGYKEQELSDIPLVWMTQHAHEQGLRIYDKHKEKIFEDETGFMHDSRGKKLAKLYRRKKRSWSVERKDKPVVHQSVINRSKNSSDKNKRKYKPWILDKEDSYDKEPWIKYSDQKWK